MRRPLVSSVLVRLGTAAAAAALVVLAVAAPVDAGRTPTLVKDINPTGNSFPTSLTQVGNTLFFAANDGVHGTELWKTDGTTTGTKMVKNIRPYGKSSSPQDLTNVNGTLFLTANDGVHGRQLWKSDGTKAGTVMVTPSGAGVATASCGAAINSMYGMYYPPVAVGNRLFYFVNGGGCAGPSAYLYVSDGTAAGTYELENAYVATDLWEEGGRNAAALNGKLYFVGSDGYDDGNDQIWVSDGTDAGTHALAASPHGGYISFLPAQGRNLYFASYDDYYFPTQLQIWKTDGTRAGTKPLTSIVDARSAQTDAVYMGKRAYFSTNHRDDVQNTDYVQLWKTDGTVAGTNPVFTKGGFDPIVDLTASGGRLFFRISDHLWKSDGTPGGTIDMGKIGAQWPRDLIGVGNELCFVEMDWDAGTWSLWESNGTKSGTYQVGTFAGSPEVLQNAAVGSKLFFAANDIGHGVELWSYTP